jgi:hypothetical protein
LKHFDNESQIFIEAFSGFGSRPQLMRALTKQKRKYEMRKKKRKGKPNINNHPFPQITEPETAAAVQGEPNATSDY